MIKTAVMGYGTIGSGVAEILDKNRDVIAGQAGQEVELKYVLDLREFPDSPVADKIVHDFKVIEQDEEVKIVVETMGGLNPAYPFVKACLMAASMWSPPIRPLWQPMARSFWRLPGERM